MFLRRKQGLYSSDCLIQLLVVQVKLLDCLPWSPKCLASAFHCSNNAHENVQKSSKPSN